MLDVYKITSVLEKLPDAALQQYASMHKQDPYVLSLAVEESNRRKRIRSAPQGEQGQAQQPPVNEQAVQAMAPEDTGIAQLPAGPMEFADGGIVAFAEGGRTEQMTPEEIRQAYNRLALRRAPAAAYDVMQMPAAAALKYGSRGLNYLFGTDLPDDYSLTPAYDKFVREPEQDLEQGVRRVPASAAKKSSESEKPSESEKAAAPPTPPERRPEERINFGSSGRTSTSTAVRAPTGGISDISAAYSRIQKANDGLDPTAGARGANEAAAMAEQQRLRDEYLANKPQDEAFTRREAALKKAEEAEPAAKEKNLKMALINAGLGMMAGTNPNAFVNIGAGAMQGVKAYQEGTKDIEKAAERRQELYDKIEEYRRTEKTADAKDRLAMGQQVANISEKYRDAATEARMKMYGLSHKVAGDLTKLMMDQEIAMMREGRADARANAAIKSQTSGNEKALMIELNKTYRTKLEDNRKKLDNSLMLSPTEKQRLEKEQSDLMGNINQLERFFREGLGISEPPAAAPVPAGNRMKFDAKGNPIQ